MNKKEVAIIPITNKCNCHCVMCNIWKSKQTNDLKLKDFENIAKSNIFKNEIRSINITGGEPFLRNDIVKIITTFIKNCNYLDSIVINTNGILTHQITNSVEDLLKYFNNQLKLIIFISLDGLGKTHDKVRGVQGSFNNVDNTIKKLLNLKKYYNFELLINTTINKYNVDNLYEIMNYVEKNNLKMDFTFPMQSTTYFMTAFDDSSNIVKEKFINFLKETINWEIINNPKTYYNSLIHMLNGEKRTIGCIFQKNGFFIKSNGDVYNCWNSNTIIGNIKDKSIDDLMTDVFFDHGICEECYNNCYYLYTRKNALERLTIKK